MVRLLGCLTRLLVLVAVAVVAFTMVLWVAGSHSGGSTAEDRGQIGTTRPVPSVASAAIPNPNAAESGRQKLVAAERTAQAAPKGSHLPVSVTFSEVEVNAIAQPELAKEQNFPLEQARVLLQSGQAVVQGRAALGPALVPVEVAGNVAVENGVPRFVVTGVQAAGVNAPRALVDQLTGDLNDRFTLTPADLPITVQAVTVGDHTLTIAGVTR